MKPKHLFKKNDYLILSTITIYGDEFGWEYIYRIGTDNSHSLHLRIKNHASLSAKHFHLVHSAPGLEAPWHYVLKY